MSKFRSTITIEVEYDEPEVLDSIVTVLDNTLPYMGDNVLVTSTTTE